jgi:hypothetical protein
MAAMTIGEALNRRSDLQKRIAQLQERLREASDPANRAAPEDPKSSLVAPGSAHGESHAPSAHQRAARTRHPASSTTGR